MAKAIKTPFYEKHVELGAKLVEFAGYIMPVQYSGIIDEHLTTRESAGIFDLSHMGEFLLTGKSVAGALNKLVTNDVEKLKPGRALYTPITTPEGGIVDDILVYRDDDDAFMLVVNAANVKKDAAWFTSRFPKTVNFKDLSLATGLIAVQGPQSEAIIDAATEEEFSELKYYEFRMSEIDGVPVRISRTGYTGEDGFEVYMDGDKGSDVWDVLYGLTSGVGGVPVGLGARDTLRLEMKYCLYGNDIDETTTPLEAGIGWTVKFAKADFLGKRPLEKQRDEGIKRNLAGFVMEDQGVPRRGFAVTDAKGAALGTVTSGSYSPSLKLNIGLAYLNRPSDAPGTEILVGIRGKPRAAKVVDTPFLKLLGGA